MNPSCKEKGADDDDPQRSGLRHLRATRASREPPRQLRQNSQTRGGMTSEVHPDGSGGSGYCIPNAQRYLEIPQKMYKVFLPQTNILMTDLFIFTNKSFLAC